MEHEAQAHAELGPATWGHGRLVEPIPEQALPGGPSGLRQGGQAAAAELQHGTESAGLLRGSSDRDPYAAHTATSELGAAAMQLPLYPNPQQYRPQAPVERSSQRAGYPAGPRHPQSAHWQERQQGSNAHQAPHSPSAAQPHRLPNQAVRLSGPPGHMDRQDFVPGQGIKLDMLPGQAAQPGDLLSQAARPGARPGHAARTARTPMYRRRSSVRMAQAGYEPGNGPLAASEQQAARLRQQAAYRYSLPRTLDPKGDWEHVLLIQGRMHITGAHAICHPYTASRHAVQRSLLVLFACVTVERVHGMSTCHAARTARYEHVMGLAAANEQCREALCM